MGRRTEAALIVVTVAALWYLMVAYVLIPEIRLWYGSDVPPF